ncbi:Lysozyme [Ancylobacter novellus DSM 506]|uniref:Lysozyme n=1 Tax=Ancylobacter novellus (strain ATCC 8093 / DSM 506 / JCM 20403 / CCM 1077 / IAM 12100 / NBRC 12443 / NCIMB 10456) TaxID=639283 RepID=D7A5Y3_ANCN5|nr:peptidoglycan-binding protein [Ancylobacter novellus]ADH90098.1 Lysozyme [Ancylobacter novellus DSM 506]
MDISSNCLDLIREFEGLRLKAYIDPVGIPTIGYGTIRYPNGTTVQMGDSISEAEAEAFLCFECEEIGRKLREVLDQVALSQNQYDAIVSFCFNLGVGAFAGSTLLQKLRLGDVPAAAAEFPRWNKGTVDGVKQELPGLTRRRARERSLFEAGGHGGTPLQPSPPSPQEQVVRVAGYREGAANIIVGFGADGAARDIVELADAHPETLIAALQSYPKLHAFEFAAPGETVPAGERTRFSGLALPLPRTKGAPKLDRPLLLVGMEDDEENPGKDIAEMQARLVELGYYRGPVDGIFNPATDAAVREFQTEFFGWSEADGRVGPKTWKKLWGDAPPKPEEAIPPLQGSAGKTYLLLTRTDRRDRYGCMVMNLTYVRHGTAVGVLEVCSGQSRKQIFRPGPHSPAGSMEPLPEGKWSIGNIEWAEGKDNYSGRIYNNGLGPAKIRMEYLDPGQTPRSAIEIHIDWNRPTAPGTAGCIGIQNISDFRTLVTWLRETDPKELFVDWGLGTCPHP